MPYKRKIQPKHPYRTRKAYRRDCTRVTNKYTKRVFSKCTTKDKAKRQIKLLNAIHYNKNFKPYGRTLP